jgi:hypothetical protein
VIHDADVLVLPVTARERRRRHRVGGSVTVLRRWTKTRIRQAIRDGDIDADAGDLLIKAMGRAAKDRTATLASGCRRGRRQGQGQGSPVYETWTKLEGRRRHAVRRLLRRRRQRPGLQALPLLVRAAPVISVPVKKPTGVFKGKPPVEAVADLQILANDTINEGGRHRPLLGHADRHDRPGEEPAVGSMVLGLAAVWETSPNDTQFAEFPSCGRTAWPRQACQAQIFQTLGVNPAMIPQSHRRREQAQPGRDRQRTAGRPADHGRRVTCSKKAS